jgi:hypothetical protein
MFDEGTKVALFGIVMAAWIFGITGEQLAPRDDLQTAVNTKGLPPLPLSVAPDGSPAQDRVSPMTVDLSHGFKAELLASYLIEGRVVTHREYRHDSTSEISPLDLGIVYGDLAKPGGVDDMEFKTSPRMLWAYAPQDADLPDNWNDLITNNHVIPANQAVNDALMAIEVGSHVRLRGYLVKVTGNGKPWRSSLRRNDGSYVGGCEIILVTDVTVLQDAPTT